MFKKFVFSLFIVGMLVGPLTTNASTFTSLKAQLEYISNKIANFSSDVKGEVLGVTSQSAPVINFKASPSLVNSGGSTTLSWSTINASECLGRDYIAGGTFGGSKNLNGSQTINNITSNRMFVLNCRGAGGETEALVFVQIIAGGPTINFSSNPSKIPYGGTSTLTWSSTGAEYCYVSGSAPGNNTAASALDINTLNGSQVISGFTDHTYFTIGCYGPGGPKEAVAAVFIENAVPKIDFKVDPNLVSSGGSSKLTWNVENATTCEAHSSPNSSWFSYNKSLTGTQIISGITKDTIFDIYCLGLVRSNRVSQTVYVKTSGPKCDYPVPPKNCSYIQGPNYNPTTNCGLVLDCKVVVDDSKVISTDTSSSKVATTNNFCAFTFTKNLGYGNVDTKTIKDVSYLQSVLVDEKLLPSSAVTGKFYAQTQTALKNFQKKYKLAQTGKVDANTRIKLNSLFQDYCNNI